MTEQVECRRLVMRGRVQGVWYRAWTVQTANALGLTGWVRNCADGSVEAVACGSGAAIDELARRCHDGPTAAEVSAVEVSAHPSELFDGFRQRASI